MKRPSKLILLITLLAFFFLIRCQPKEKTDGTAESGSKTEDRKQVELPRFPSPAALVEQTVGLSNITINYSRPSVIAPNGIDRTNAIWGKLVPYDFEFRPAMSAGKPIPWRAGANENTTISLSHDAKIEEQHITAGTYGLHMAIHRDGTTTLIFSNKSDAWGSFSYDEDEDALRVKINTQEIPPRKRLIYFIDDVGPTSAVVALEWETKRIAFKVEFDTHNLVLGDFRAYLSDTTGLTWRDYNRAARYCADNSVNLEEGMTWTLQSIAMEKNYDNLSTKSLLLALAGQNEQAVSVKNEALELTATQANHYYSFGTELLSEGKIEEAMNIYQRLAERWPDHWLTAHGLARGYSAQGDYAKAIKYERDALTKAPENNKGFIVGAIEKLERGQDFN